MARDEDDADESEDESDEESLPEDMDDGLDDDGLVRQQAEMSVNYDGSWEA